MCGIAGIMFKKQGNKAAVGKATVQRMLVEERRNTSRVWMSSVAAALDYLGK